MPKAIGIRTAQNNSERLTGQVHVYDGEGKGKSQVALGVVLRSIGLGIHQFMESRVLLLRFLKGPGRTYDEDAAIEALQRGFPHLIDQVRTGRAEFFGPEEITKFDKQEAQRGWEVAKGAIASGLYSVVVLDEINPVLDLDLLSIEDVVRSLKNKPDHLEIIATGRGAPPQLVEIADLHSEMKPQIHQTAADIGIEGIEIYTGDGKGKSTSALATALPAIGRGIFHDFTLRGPVIECLYALKWFFVDAAIAALRKSYPHLVDHQRCGRDAIVWRGQQQPIDYIEAERGWELASTAIASGLYKTIILDELNPTVDLELLPEEPIIQTLLRKPKGTEVIITGRCKNQPGYFQLASTHSEVFCHKHYAERGVELKRGVDF